MKIIIFIENNQSGGMDSFCSTLLNSWPDKNDSFVCICNASHPGVSILRASILGSCQFVTHKIPLSWEVSQGLFGWLPISLMRFSQPLLRILLFPLQRFVLRRLFQRLGGDRLLVLNGGFPGGETCRIANIAWSDLGRAPGIHNFHNFAVPPRFGLGWYENWVDRKLIVATDTFISVSRVCAESLRIRPSFRNLFNIVHIYNGIDGVLKGNAETPDLRQLFQIGSDPLCLILANYESRKGHGFLFKAFAKVAEQMPSAHLLVCGGGSKEQVAVVDALRRTIAPKAHVYLLEFVPNGARLIEQVDLVLISSQSFESFGLTAVEAMLRGVPVVSTNVGGLPEVIGSDGEGGFTVAPNDVDGFVRHILDLLASPALRAEVGERGRQRAKQLFDAGRMAREYRDVIGVSPTALSGGG